MEVLSEIDELRRVVVAKQAAMTANEDPWDFPEAQRLLALERAESRKQLDKLHPGNRLRLMFGQPLLPERR